MKKEEKRAAEETFERIAAELSTSNPDVDWKLKHTRGVVSAAERIFAAVSDEYRKRSGTEIAPEDPERIVFLSALFHDIGRFVQFSSNPELAASVRGVGHGETGKKIIESLRGEKIFRSVPEREFALLLSLVARHDANFLSLETEPAMYDENSKRRDRRSGTGFGRRVFLFFADLLRDADMTENCATLYGPAWKRRIETGGYARFDHENGSVSDDLYERFASLRKTASRRELAAVFDAYRAKTMGDAASCLYAAPLFRFAFAPSRRFAFESDLEEKTENLLSRDKRTSEIFEFLKSARRKTV